MIALHCASPQLGTMELLEEDLTCPICCCLFDDPRVLLCSHSFCKKCLEGILEGSRGGPAWRPPFKCPTCRKETPHNGANSLQINYSLRGIVEKYNKIRVLPRMSLCKQHSGQPLNIFCATDVKLICGFCATTGDHKGHAFSALDDAYEQEKAAFEELLRGLESRQSSADLLSCLETLEANKKKALQSVSREAEKVRDYLDKLIGALEHKKSELLFDFDTLKLVVMQTYDPEIAKLSAVLEEQRRALSIAESFRSAESEPEPLRFLQQMQEFREKQRQVLLRETPLPSRTDMDVGPLVRQFDVRKWDSLRLREVDKISVPPPHETGSYRAGGGTSRMSGLRRITVFVGIVLPTLLLLQPDNPAAYVSSLYSLWSSHVEPFLTAISSHLACTGLYWQEVTGLCASLMGAGQSCIQSLIDFTINFVGSCKLL